MILNKREIEIILAGFEWLGSHANLAEEELVFLKKAELAWKGYNERESALENLRDAIQQCEDNFSGVWASQNNEYYSYCNSFRITGAMPDEYGNVVIGNY